MADLSALFPDREILLGEEKLTVSPFKFGQFKAVLEILERYTNLGGNWIEAILAEGEQGMEDLATLTLFCVDRDRAWLDDLSGDLALDLFFKVFEVNADFFIGKVTAGAAAIAATIQKAGASRSVGSSEQGTDGPTSKPTPKGKS